MNFIMRDIQNMSITLKARNKILVKIPSGLGRLRAPQYWRYV